MSGSDQETSFEEYSDGPIDTWSLSVFEAYRDWSLARTGRWLRSDEGWLRLRIEQFEGEWLEPSFAIELDTAHEQILVAFGSWCASISDISALLAQADQHPSGRARELIEGWLTGVVTLVSYSDETGWR